MPLHLYRKRTRIEAIRTKMKMNTLNWFLWKLWNRYPTQSLIYVSLDNGVVGAVCAEDYDREVYRMRKEFSWNRWPTVPVRPQVYPVFLFSNKNPGNRSFRVGTEEDLTRIIRGCAVEFRDFELPPLNAPGYTPLGYFGAREEIDSENARRRKWTLDQAREYLHGGQITTYNL